MCQCFQVGSPFISEDPDCQIHGIEAQAREREETSLWEAPFVAETHLMNLITQIVTAKTLGQEREVDRLMREATHFHMNRACEDDYYYAEQQVRNIVLFFAK